MLQTVSAVTTEESDSTECCAAVTSVNSCCMVKDSSKFCWYHANFGSDATRCRPPCNWSVGEPKQQGNGRGGKKN